MPEQGTTSACAQKCFHRTPTMLMSSAWLSRHARSSSWIQGGSSDPKRPVLIEIRVLLQRRQGGAAATLSIKAGALLPLSASESEGARPITPRMIVCNDSLRGVALADFEGRGSSLSGRASAPFGKGAPLSHRVSAHICRGCEQQLFRFAPFRRGNSRWPRHRCVLEIVVGRR